MENIYDNILIGFRDKIKRIINLYETEKEKNNNIEKQIKTLEAKLERTQKDYKTLEQRYNNLKLAKSLTLSAKDEHEAKKTVSGIVREIDKCLALLNR